MSAARRLPRPGGDGASLYRRCLAGDEQAWAEVLALALEIARRRCRAIPAEVEEVALEVVEKLLEPGVLQTLNEPAAFRGFVATMTVRAVINRLRAPGRRRRVDHDDAGDEQDSAIERSPDREPPPDVKAADREAWEVVQQAIARLPAPCVEVVHAYLEHIALNPRGSYKTLARAFETSVSTISSRVTRCIDRLLEDPRARAVLAVGEG